MSPPNLPQLPPNVKRLLSAYIGETQLKELPACFTQRSESTIHKTDRGPITYKYHTGQILTVRGYPWKSAHKEQTVVVASGEGLIEPVIIVPATLRSSLLKIWKGEENDNDEYTPCPIVKVFSRGSSHANFDLSHNEATIPSDEDDEEYRPAAKRPRIHYRTSSSNDIPTAPFRRRVVEINTTPEQLPPIQPSPSAIATPALVNDGTTFVFLDGNNRELRRRTFAELGKRLNVSTLFGQAIRAGLVDKSDFGAILSATIQGVGETFAILRDDAPDFAKLMQRLEGVGLCMVKVRLD